MSGSLDHAPIKIIKQLMLDLTLGSEVNADDEWPIFLDQLPDDDDVNDDALSVNTTEGIGYGRRQIDGERIEDHGMQIFIRSTTRSIGYAKAEAIKNKLDGLKEYTTVVVGTSSYEVKNMNRTTDVLSLGPETETDRRQFAVNYLATLRQIS